MSKVVNKNKKEIKKVEEKVTVASEIATTDVVPELAPAVEVLVSTVNDDTAVDVENNAVAENTTDAVCVDNIVNVEAVDKKAAKKLVKKVLKKVQNKKLKINKAAKKLVNVLTKKL
ncbi:MAG: hypothetical protein ACYDD5_11415 [Sulfuricurvum sp.]|nr:MAG: hypothetical protein B7Y30_11205 [Campylobacterales bacterium 16-40-21]OZA01813.1 MAG: hypothetical protein B7X89_11915 [Sulfuricurvum sp. 17-40-25]HQT37585.1 hypothetical protein [Sulfuricurvum sp.]